MLLPALHGIRNSIAASTRGGFHRGAAGWNVDFIALGDVVGGDKVTNIFNTTIQRGGCRGRQELSLRAHLSLNDNDARGPAQGHIPGRQLIAANSSAFLPRAGR
jgi:hypothetical protein